MDPVIRSTHVLINSLRYVPLVPSHVVFVLR